MSYTAEQHKEALKLFIPAKGYEVHTYYGASMIKLKKNNKFSIKLMHGWSESGKNSVMSKEVIINKFEDAMQLYTLLEEFSEDGETKSANLSFLNKSEPSIVKNAFEDSEEVTNEIISQEDDVKQASETEPVTGKNAFD